jgi:hypothetical protein
VGTNNSRWDKHEEDDAAEKGANERVRVFYPGQICFIYKHILMGLRGGKAQNTFLGISSAASIEESTYQGKRCVQKKKRREERTGDKKISIKKQKHKFTSSLTQGLVS